jgi:ABC-type uncharacterized transport system auxiliary subunit
MTSGCVSLLPQPTPSGHAFMLSVPPYKAQGKHSAALLVVDTPVVSPILNNNFIQVVRREKGALVQDHIAGWTWSQPLPDEFQDKLVQMLSQGNWAGIGRRPHIPHAHFVLDAEIMAWGLWLEPQPHIHGEIRLTLQKGETQDFVKQKVFTYDVPVSQTQPHHVQKGFQKALDQFMTDTMHWLGQAERG